VVGKRKEKAHTIKCVNDKFGALLDDEKKNRSTHKVEYCFNGMNLSTNWAMVTGALVMHMC